MINNICWLHHVVRSHTCASPICRGIEACRFRVFRDPVYKEKMMAVRAAIEKDASAKQDAKQMPPLYSEEELGAAVDFVQSNGDPLVTVTNYLMAARRAYESLTWGLASPSAVEELIDNLTNITIEIEDMLGDLDDAMMAGGQAEEPDARMVALTRDVTRSRDYCYIDLSHTHKTCSLESCRTEGVCAARKDRDAAIHEREQATGGYSPAG